MFKQNRIISISSRVIEFGVSGSLRLWGVGRWVDRVGGGWRVPPTYLHMHACTRTHMHAW